MNSRILSLNIGGPAELLWGDRKLRTSMVKTPVAGPLVVHEDHIEGNSFANSNHHGGPYAILYAYGVPSLRLYSQSLGLADFAPGFVGETLTLDEFDEDQISIGDVFEIGEVQAQAAYPRIPCAKLNYLLQAEQGQKAMEDCGKSGVYFRILKPGRITQTDTVKRVSQSSHPILLGPIYRKLMKREAFTREELAHAQLNGAVPPKMFERWSRAT